MPQLTLDHIEEFQTQGYTILLEALSTTELTTLHDEADMLANYLMDEGIDIVKNLGCIIEPLECGYLDPSHKTYKTHITAYQDRRDQVTPGIAHFLTTTVASWARQLLQGVSMTGPDIYLLNEQYIIKPPKTKSISQFAWHRDSDYYQDATWENEVSVACWMALDDVNEENGTVLIGSLGKGKEAEQVKHSIRAPAGSIVFMSSRLAHKSTGNASSRFRRAFMPQYSSRPFLDPLSGLPIALAIPI